MSLPHESMSPLGLHLTFAAGKGVATLRERRLGDIDVERLDLEIPKLVFPFDISGGTARFQSRRCVVRAASFSVNEAVLESWLRERTKESKLRVKVREGYLGLAGRYFWQPNESIELTAKLFLDISYARSAFILLDDLRLYGVPPVPAPLISISLLNALRPTLPETYRVIGTCAAELEPLRLLVAHYLPVLGWKIPDVREVRLEEVRAQDGKLSFRYGPSDAMTQPPSPLKETWRAKEALRLCNAAEDLLAQGKLTEALQRLRRDTERVGEHPFIDLRIGEILAADPERGSVAQAHLEAALSRHEGSPIEARLQMLMAQVYLRDHDPIGARPYLEALATLAESGEDADEALFSGHWIARAISETEPLPAISRLEKLAQQHAGHKPTILALAALYERAGHYEELALLWRELAATEEDQSQAALLRAKLGDLYYQKLRDPLRAKGQYERALSRDPRCIEAWCGLSDVLVEQNETRPALLALEEALSTAPTDAVKAKIHVKAGLIWENALSDPESASLRYGEALLLVPHMPEALWHMASLHKTRRRYARAATCYEELARHKELSAKERSKAFYSLAQLLEDFLGDPEEAFACARRAQELDPNNDEAQALQDRVVAPKKTNKALERSKEKTLLTPQNSIATPKRPAPRTAPEQTSKQSEDRYSRAGRGSISSAPRRSNELAPRASNEDEAFRETADFPRPSPRLSSPKLSISDLETPQALPAQKKTAVTEMLTPPQRPAVKREVTPVFLQEEKAAPKEETPRLEKKTPKPTFEPRAEVTPRPRLVEGPQEVEDSDLEALADLALFDTDYAKPFDPFGNTPIKQAETASKPIEEARPLSGPPRLESENELLQAAREAEHRGQESAAKCYRAISRVFDKTFSEENFLLPKDSFTPPTDALLAPRDLFLALSPFVGSLANAPSPETEPGPVSLAEEMFSIAADMDAPRFILRWAQNDSARALLGEIATLALGSQLLARPKEERFLLIAHAISSIRLALPLVQMLSPAELEEMVFLMAAACDPVSVVADEGSLTEGLRAQAEALLAQAPESKKESLLPAVSTLLDSYGAIDFKVFQRGLIEESWREVLCAGADLSVLLSFVALADNLPIEKALQSDSLTRRTALFACKVSNAPVAE